MEKRYQVFVSSTYADLQDERKEVMQALLELDCIPAGMELFPAADEDQWTLIKKVIDDCDYYMVIIAGRYGSIGPQGLSYTEMEYRYAVETGKPILGFVHGDPSSLAAGRCETDTDGKARLEEFRALAKKKLCRFWSSPADLGSQVSRSLVKLIKTNPGIGWVRANLVPDQGATAEILGLRRQIEDLQAQIEKSRVSGPEGISKLAQGEDQFIIRYKFTAGSSQWSSDRMTYEAEVSVKWNDIFAALSPSMIHESTENEISITLNRFVRSQALPELQKDSDFKGMELFKFIAFPDDFQTVKIQLRALGLITQSTKSRSVKDVGTYWTLTPFGDSVMTRLRAIKRED